MPRFPLVRSILLVLLLAAPSNADAPADLSTLVRRAEARNPDLRAAQATLEAAQSAAIAAGAWEAPMVQAGVMNVAGLGGPSIAVSQAVPGGDKLSLVQRAAQADARAAAALVVATRLDVARQLVARYYDVAAIARVEAVYREERARLNALVRIASAKYATGQGLRQDVVSAQLELAQLLAGLAEVEQQRLDALAAINALADRPGDAPVRLASRLPLGASAPADSFNRRVLAHNPDLLAAAARRDAAEARLALATRQLSVPDLLISVQAGRSMPGDMAYLGGMVGLNLPWLNEGRLGARAAGARHTLEARQADVEAQRVKLLQRASSLRNRLARIDRQRELIRQGLMPLSAQSFQAAITAYQVDKLPFESVITAQDALFKIEMQATKLAGERLGVLAALSALAGDEPLEARIR